MCVCNVWFCICTSVVIDGKHSMLVLGCAWGLLPEGGSSGDTILKPVLAILVNEMTCEVVILEVYDSTQVVSVGHQPYSYIYSVMEDWCINAPFKSKHWGV